MCVVHVVRACDACWCVTVACMWCACGVLQWFVSVILPLLVVQAASHALELNSFDMWVQTHIMIDCMTTLFKVNIATCSSLHDKITVSTVVVVVKSILVLYVAQGAMSCSLVS